MAARTTFPKGPALARLVEELHTTKRSSTLPQSRSNHVRSISSNTSRYRPLYTARHDDAYERGRCVGGVSTSAGRRDMSFMSFIRGLVGGDTPSTTATKTTPTHQGTPDQNSTQHSLPV